jgi:hypothetical protein
VNGVRCHPEVLPLLVVVLIDPSTRTIGKIIAGRMPVLLTPKYEMKTYFDWSRASH